VPWCEDCSKFWNPNSMPPDGTCPTCGEIIADPPDTKVPWHFWTLLAALGIYLGYRVVQGFEWLVNNDHAPWAVLCGVALVGVTAAGAAWNWWPGGGSMDEPGEPTA
jgi:hypothetical protein